jgi:hypothetical protein
MPAWCGPSRRRSRNMGRGRHRSRLLGQSSELRSCGTRMRDLCLPPHPNERGRRPRIGWIAVLLPIARVLLAAVHESSDTALLPGPRGRDPAGTDRGSGHAGSAGRRSTLTRAAYRCAGVRWHASRTRWVGPSATPARPGSAGGMGHACEFRRSEAPRTVRAGVAHASRRAAPTAVRHHDPPLPWLLNSTAPE